MENKTIKNLATLLMFVGFLLVASSGYDFINYLLGKIFSVEIAEATALSFVYSFIYLISGAFLFTGGFLLHNMKPSSPMVFSIGLSGLILSDVLSMFDGFFKLAAKSQKTQYDIQSAAMEMGGSLAFSLIWLFLIYYFNRSSFKEKLTTIIQ